MENICYLVYFPPIFIASLNFYISFFPLLYARPRLICAFYFIPLLNYTFSHIIIYKLIKPSTQIFTNQYLTMQPNNLFRTCWNLFLFLPWLFFLLLLFTKPVAARIAKSIQSFLQQVSFIILAPISCGVYNFIRQLSLLFIFSSNEYLWIGTQNIILQFFIYSAYVCVRLTLDADETRQFKDANFGRPDFEMGRECCTNSGWPQLLAWDIEHVDIIDRDTEMEFDKIVKLQKRNAISSYVC